MTEPPQKSNRGTTGYSGELGDLEPSLDGYRPVTFYEAQGVFHPIWYV